MPNRSTLWRRLKRAVLQAPVNQGLGRREKDVEDRKTVIAKIAAWTVAKKRNSPPVKIQNAFSNHFAAYEVGIDFKAWSYTGAPLELALAKKLFNAPYPTGMLMVAVCDGLRLNPRRREGSKVKESEMLRMLVEDYRMEKRDAERVLIKQPEWLQALVPDRPLEAYVSSKLACPSRVFPALTRRMVSYWRKQELYAHAVQAIAGIAYSRSSDNTDIESLLPPDQLRKLWARRAAMMPPLEDE